MIYHFLQLSVADSNFKLALLDLWTDWRESKDVKKYWWQICQGFFLNFLLQLPWYSRNSPKVTLCDSLGLAGKQKTIPPPPFITYDSKRNGQWHSIGIELHNIIWITLWCFCFQLMLRASMFQAMIYVCTWASFLFVCLFNLRWENQRI